MMRGLSSDIVKLLEIVMTPGFDELFDDEWKLACFKENLKKED